MFLNELKVNEKEAFISLCVQAAVVNDDFAVEEKQMITEYCKEMGIVFFDAENVKSMDEICAIFSCSSEQVKKIAVLEIVGLVYSDGVYDDIESDFINDFAKRIGLSQETVDMQIANLTEYLAVVKKLADGIC